MGNILLAVTILIGLNILSPCTAHLPYYNNRATPPRTVTNQNYWYTSGRHSSYHHQKENYSIWHHISSKPTVSRLLWQNKFVPFQHNAVKPSSSMAQTTKYDRSPPIQQPSLTTQPEYNVPADKQTDLSDLKTLIHQLERKLEQIEQQLSGNGTIKQDHESVTKETFPKSDPKLIEDIANDPFWVKLDVVNKEIDLERLIKAVKLLLENLNESTPAPIADRSEENVYDLIDIRSNFSR
ncbi:uncharacterized protein LOC128712499 [Anopheles marshallii]|uniref:uncharacterized protein LOC128712499 n=1 Tax=Anopheles marshallii TaxID=1521116 RepID=UPI00237BDBD7|nr:uncharacterized protein LOC128712499 [Anopheles marshallii]